MINAAPQSTSETTARSVKPRIGTPDHLNSETAVVVNPFVNPAVKETCANDVFVHNMIEFVMLHWRITLANTRMLMNQAKAYNAKVPEATRFAMVVQQAENFCYNQNHEHIGHWAVWHADPVLIRAFEAWPNDTFHQRFVKVKQALGNLSTLFNYAGFIEQAKLDLETFISTGIIPQPPAIPEATKEAVKLDTIAKRNAELETGEAELDKWFGPKKESKAVTDSSNGKILGDYLKTQQSWGAWWTSAKNLCKANGIKEEDLDAHIHEVLLGPGYGDRSAKTYPGTPGDALGAVKDSFSKPKTKASENGANKPASAPVASTPVTEPAKDEKPQAQDIPAVETKPAETVLTGEIVPEVKKPALVMVPNTGMTALGMMEQWQIMRQQADVLIKSGFLPQSIKTPEQALAIMMMGSALQIDAIVALNTINVIQGKPTVSPQLMLALVRRSGQLEHFRTFDEGDCAVVEIKRRGETMHVERFSVQDANAMGLSGKDNWRKQPATMRKWRAVAAACRVVFPDVTWGIASYTTEEIDPDYTVEAA